MTISQPQDPDEKPLDPEAERVRRRLVRFMVINLGLLFAAVIAVLIAVVYKASFLGDDARTAATVTAVPPGEVVSGDIPLPEGARVVAHDLSGGTILLRVELPGGEQALILYDMAEARVTGRFALVAEGD